MRMLAWNRPPFPPGQGGRDALRGGREVAQGLVATWQVIDATGEFPEGARARSGSVLGARRLADLESTDPANVKTVPC